ALALHLLIHQLFDFEHKWMKESHLTLRHYQARDIRLWRYPPLRARRSTPIEFTKGVSVVARPRLQDKRACQPEPPTTKFPRPWEPYPLSGRHLLGLHHSNGFSLDQGGAAGKEPANQRLHVRQG